ncbi:MAG: hypothetical protein MJ033_08060 [Victivallaceae bacterium]|nr:hypothetical protein [Victivallaceae bacterium]
MIKTLIAVVLLTAMVFLFLVAACCIPSVGNVVFAIAGGSVYRQTGSITAKINGKNIPLAVYRKTGKPFLIVGPCRFQEEEENYEDFFFVDHKRVIRTAVDKGGDIWFRAGRFLFILDDLSGCERLRAPVWDDLQSDPTAYAFYDDAKSEYIYSFKINSHSTPVAFSIPKKWLMPIADTLN